MSKRQEIRERKAKEKKQKTITLGAIIIGAGLVLAALIYATPKPQTIENFESRYMASDNTMGDPNAPVKIVEFADYKCGHCAAFTFETEPLIVTEYIETGKVYFVSRSVGGMLSGAEPMLAAEASYCAGEQNKYWEMHDIIFANQATPFTSSLISDWAETVGLDMKAYNDCMKDNRYAERANQDEADAKAAGINGTPSFIISYEVDGEVIQQMLPGNYPYEAFQQIIEEGLTATGN